MNLNFITARPVAHRGLHGLSEGIVENCPRAFEAAIAANYAIECDLQLSKDDDAIVFHDYSLDRLTHETGLVQDHTIAELKAMRFKETDDHMITLADLLSLTQGQVPLVVEVKSKFNGDMRLVARAAELASTYHGPICLMSFDPAPIAWLKIHAPHLTRGIVTESHYTNEEWRKVPPATLQAMKDFSHEAETEPHFLSWHIGDMPNAITKRYRAAQKPVLCWTVRTKEQRAMAEDHADQVTFEGYLHP